ncbi:hypothetical protein D5H75_40630 [Bailinhaonella thermotolerans]|uniref:Uncharacterized protein n=1 Tax=Bailinhaonella thermotolerans TaxID=1070861 RepID=A0A3A3ZZ11_9ACTN|nr:hypothetical protein D5H75_40630 [Bailinhaonella thermotolerans]
MVQGRFGRHGSGERPRRRRVVQQPSWHTLCGHFRDSQPFWTAAGQGVPSRLRTVAYLSRDEQAQHPAARADRAPTQKVMTITLRYFVAGDAHPSEGLRPPRVRAN